jgi:aminoglycoside phosphotransferase
VAVNPVSSYIAAHHERLGLERLGIRRRPSCLLLTPRFRLSRHIIVLVLAPCRREPVLVAKLPRLAGDSGALAREARNLRAVEPALAGHGEGTAPALVAFHDDVAYPLLLETALGGRPLSPAAVRRNRDGIVARVAVWLERLAAATAAMPRDDTWYERLVSVPLLSLAASPGQAPEVRSMVERTLEHAEALRATSLPLVFEHGDLGHPNLLCQADGRLGVLDWESAESAGLPAHDLFFFLAFAAMAGHRATGDRRSVSSVRAAFFGARPWAWPVVERYGLRLGIDAALLRPLLAVSCARVVAASGGPSRPTRRPASDAAGRHMLLWRYVLDEGSPTGLT